MKDLKTVVYSKNHFANPQKQDKESTKVYNSQNSEKTIVENTNDRTKIDVSKKDDPLLTKPIIEKTSISSSALLYLILFLLFVFLIGHKFFSFLI